MARANRSAAPNGNGNGHPKLNGKPRFIWPDDTRDWRDERDEAGPVSRNGHGKASNGHAGHAGANGHPSPNGPRAEREKVYLKPSDIVIDTPGQVAFAHALRTQRVIWGIGSAGAGKTCVAVRDAVEKLQSGRVRGIVLMRPAVEAGDTLGYQPGDTDAKISGYMSPMLEELGKFYGPSDIRRMKAEGVLRTIALQFLRGYNLEDTAIILDEAHNAVAKHIQLALQRICRGTTLAILGDLERNAPGHPDGEVLKQSDLKPELQGGLEYWIRTLDGIPGIARVDMTPLDCHRDPLVRLMQARGL